MKDKNEIKYDLLQPLKKTYSLFYSVIILISKCRFIFILLFGTDKKKDDILVSIKKEWENITLLSKDYKEILVSLLFLISFGFLLPIVQSLIATLLLLEEPKKDKFKLISEQLQTIQIQSKHMQNQLDDLKILSSETIIFSKKTENNKPIEIYFENGKSIINDQFSSKNKEKNIKKLKTLVANLENNSGYTFSIVGFASASPILNSNINYNTNYELSLARARNTKQKIIDLLAKTDKQLTIKFHLSAKATEGNINYSELERKTLIKVYKWNREISSKNREVNKPDKSAYLKENPIAILDKFFITIRSNLNNFLQFLFD